MLMKVVSSEALSLLPDLVIRFVGCDSLLSSNGILRFTASAMSRRDDPLAYDVAACDPDDFYMARL